MTENFSRRFIENFTAVWGEVAPKILERPSSLTSLSLREVTGDQIGSALAVAATWSAAYVAECRGVHGGIVLLLFKLEDDATLNRLAKVESDGGMKPGTRALAAAIFAAVAQVASDEGDFSIGEVAHLDLTIDEARLKAMVGDQLWVGTFALVVEGELDTQALLIYAPQGSLKPIDDLTAQRGFAAQAAQTASRLSGARPTSARNIERLLDVELEVVVRFGMTTMPLRDVVRMGVGTMVELNRTVDEPVELLVNGRPLARGEVVVVDGYYGIRITEIGAPTDRALSVI